MKSRLILFTIVIASVSIAAQCAETDGISALIRTRPPLNEPHEVLIKLAENGNADAQFDLGWIAFQKNDWAAAANWFQKSADNGNSNAKFNLSMLIAVGDPSLSYKYALESANDGLVFAMYEVGIRLMDGSKGAPKQVTEGTSWLIRAAHKGDALAQLKLGSNYFLGLGVNRNLIESHIWLSLSNAKGLDNRKRLVEVEQHMTPEQITEAIKLARERSERFLKKK